MPFTWWVITPFLFDRGILYDSENRYEVCHSMEKLVMTKSSSKTGSCALYFKQWIHALGIGFLALMTLKIVAFKSNKM